MIFSDPATLHYPLRFGLEHPVNNLTAEGHSSGGHESRSVFECLSVLYFTSRGKGYQDESRA